MSFCIKRKVCGKLILICLSLASPTLNSTGYISLISNILSTINIGNFLRPTVQRASRHVPATLFATAAVVGSIAIAFPVVRRCLLNGWLSLAARYRSTQLLRVARLCRVDLNRPDAQNRTLLCRAAECGDLKMVTALLQAGVDPNFYEPFSHKAAIHYAVKHGHTNIVTALANAGTNMFLADFSGELTPLLPMGLAIEKKDINMVRCLLDNGVSSNASCTWRDPATMPLVKALRKGVTDIVRLLIGRGADINYRDPQSGKPVLYMAADCDNETGQLIRLFLEAGAQIPTKDERIDCHYDTFKDQRARVMIVARAIHHAVITDDVGLVRELAAQNEDLNEAKIVTMGDDKFWATPLFIAVKKKNEGMYKILLEVAKNTQKMIEAALELAVKAHDVESVTFIVNQGVDKLMLGRILGFAACTLDTEMVDVLISAGADVNARFSKGATPLYVAHCLQVTRLLRAGAKPNVIDDEGWTPLMNAWRKDDFSVLNLLLAEGADISLRGTSYRSSCLAQLQRNPQLRSGLFRKMPDFKEFVERAEKLGNKFLDVVSQGDIQTVEKMLADKFVPKYMVDQDENSPLHVAARTNNPVLVKMLVAASNVECTNKQGNTYLNKRNKNGQTPLHLAALSKNWSIYRYLRMHGADMCQQDKKGNLAFPSIDILTSNKVKFADVFAPYTDSELDRIKGIAK